MSVRALTLMVVAVLGVAGALLLALGEGAPRPARPEPAAREPSARPPGGVTEARAAEIVPPRPAREPMAPPVAAPRPVLGTTSGDQVPLWRRFDDEQRDDAWASAREDAVRAKLAVLRAAIGGERARGPELALLECRRASCRLAFTARDESALGRLLDALQDERGFYGDAEQLALDGYGSSPDKATGDTITQVRVHLTWARQ